MYASEECNTPPPYYEHISSAAPPVASSTPATASLRIASYNRIKVIGFSREDIAEIYGVISSVWSKGIQEHELKHITTCWKLQGTPWLKSSTFSSGTEEVQRLMHRILETLFNQAWLLQATTTADMHQRVLLFRKTAPSTPRRWCSFYWIGEQSLIMVDVPEMLRFAMINGLQGCLRKHGKTLDSYLIQFRDPEFKNRNERAQGNLMKVFGILTQHGYQIYTDIELYTGAPSGTRNQRTWVLCTA